MSRYIGEVSKVLARIESLPAEKRDVLSSSRSVYIVYTVVVVVLRIENPGVRSILAVLVILVKALRKKKQVQLVIEQHNPDIINHGVRKVRRDLDNIKKLIHQSNCILY